MMKMLAQLLKKAATIEELTALLEVLLTNKERQEIAQRIEIVQRLEMGEAQHKIAQALKVGVATVTRGSAALKSKYYKDTKHLFTKLRTTK